MALRQEASTGEFVEDMSASVAGAQPVKKVSRTLHVKIWSPFRVYFDADAQSVSGVNATGPFDILAQHRNFISLLNACDLLLRTSSGEVRIRISGGVMQVHQNMVKVFLEV
jgi:F0F1-type ATP synthase epsilon subunit